MVAIINYKAGNIRSVQNALNRLGVASSLTDDPEEISKASKVIFPGVGEASTAMANLRSKRLDKIIPELTQPVLGICLGMQLMCEETEEGDTKGLGIFSTKVKRFPQKVRVPHMGWNDFTLLDSELFRDIATLDDMYFVHSYYAETCDDTIATCEYGGSFSAALQRNNFYGVQFHPEKSAGKGGRLLANFLEL